jgi:hypothetical protein
MKRILSMSLVIALAALLVVPSAAFSTPGGHGKGGVHASAKGGHGKAASRNAAANVVNPATKAKTAHKAKSAARHQPKGVSHSAAKAARVTRHGITSGLETTVAPEADETSGSAEASAPAAPTKLTGIANALSHIQANLARMQARVDAGVRRQLPSGLLGVVQKFMAWLGLAPAPVSGGSGGETTGTVEPTGTIEPTQTVVPTGTVEPTLSVEPSAAL